MTCSNIAALANTLDIQSAPAPQPATRNQGKSRMEEAGVRLHEHCAACCKAASCLTLEHMKY